ncbi:MAG: Hsp20/alpha crystallin family protein [Nitrospirota bacterium]
MAETPKEVQKKEAESPVRGERTKLRKVYTPAVDIVERKDDIVMMADMPGVDEKSVDITVEKNILTISGTVEASAPENRTMYIAEYGVGDYQRVFTLTDEVDKDKIQATVKNGVLKIVLPKAEALKTRKIAVKAEA